MTRLAADQMSRRFSTFFPPLTCYKPAVQPYVCLSVYNLPSFYIQELKQVFKVLINLRILEQTHNENLYALRYKSRRMVCLGSSKRYRFFIIKPGGTQLRIRYLFSRQRSWLSRKDAKDQSCKILFLVQLSAQTVSHTRLADTRWWPPHDCRKPAIESS